MALGFNSEILNEDVEYLELVGMDYREYLSINPHIDPETLEDYFDHMESTRHLNEDYFPPDRSSYSYDYDEEE